MPATHAAQLAVHKEDPPPLTAPAPAVPTAQTHVVAPTLFVVAGGSVSVPAGHATHAGYGAVVGSRRKAPGAHAAHTMSAVVVHAACRAVPAGHATVHAWHWVPVAGGGR